jgi:hypothetical protein
MAKPIKQVTKLPGRVLREVGLVPEAPSAMPAATAATPIAPIAPISAPAAETGARVTPKSAVSLGGEDQMAASTEQTRRRRAAGMVTGSRGLTTAAQTTRKTLLGQ